MTPEVQVLLINAAGLALAYGAIYPALLPITLVKIMIADALVTAVLLAIAGYMFWDFGAEFWLLGWRVHPVLFALLTLLVMEMPLFSWFAKKHDLRF